MPPGGMVAPEYVNNPRYVGTTAVRLILFRESRDQNARHLIELRFIGKRNVCRALL